MGLGEALGYRSNRDLAQSGTKKLCGGHHLPGKPLLFNNMRHQSHFGKTTH